MQHLSERPRRLRNKAFLRQLCRENEIRTSDLIWPLFFRPREQLEENIATMPGVKRWGYDNLLHCCEKALKLGIQAIALFPVIDDSKKNDTASLAASDDGPVAEAVRRIKSRFSELGVITDVALDPYTSHGQDGLIDHTGYVLNDETVELLCNQALSHARAGADIVAPSDMMDGRVGAIRSSLEEAGHINTVILSYTAKYASSLYGPFRDAVQAKLAVGADKKTYQLDPANRIEAQKEAVLDIEEGADILMVKPALAYLDIISDLCEVSTKPVWAYQVSGEYAMIEAACNAGYLPNKDAVIYECLTAIKRAGASGILTYYAPYMAELLRK